MERREWEKDLPREQFRQFPKIAQSQPWFEVYDIGYDVYAIYEPYQFQEVISYLIKGEDRALLLDTGNGIGDMKRLTDELWDKELVVVNSHAHFDHVGGNHQFQSVHVFCHPYMMQVIENGIPDEVYQAEYAEDTYSAFSPLPYRPLHYRPFSYRLIEPGHIFDLGGRQLGVIETPGHSPDSIMLVEERKKLLFTGDTYYPATLYCFTAGMFDTYAQTMGRLALEYRDFQLITSHNEPLRPGTVLETVAREFDRVLAGDVPHTTEGPNEKYEFETFTLLKR